MGTKAAERLFPRLLLCYFLFLLVLFRQLQVKELLDQLLNSSVVSEFQAFSKVNFLFLPLGLNFPPALWDFVFLNMFFFPFF